MVGEIVCWVDERKRAQVTLIMRGIGGQAIELARLLVLLRAREQFGLCGPRAFDGVIDLILTPFADDFVTPFPGAVENCGYTSTAFRPGPDARALPTTAGGCRRWSSELPVAA